MQCGSGRRRAEAGKRREEGELGWAPETRRQVRRTAGEREVRTIRRLSDFFLKFVCVTASAGPGAGSRRDVQFGGRAGR